MIRQLHNLHEYSLENTTIHNRIATSPSTFYSMGTVRNSPFMRQSPSPASPGGRPKSTLFATSLSPVTAPTTSPPPSSGHVRGKSLSGAVGSLASSEARPTHARNSSKGDAPQSNTFAPSFIKSEDIRRNPDVVSGIEGENDFSGKRYVWLKDPQAAFVKGWVVEDLGGNRILVQCDDGSVSGCANGRYLGTD